MAMPHKVLDSSERAKRTARSLDWNHRHPEKMRAASMKQYQLAKSRVLIFFGNQCDYCGTSENLQLHHIHCNGNAHRKEIKRGEIYRWLTHHWDQFRLFRLLCFSCHKLIYRRSVLEGLLC